MEVDLGFKSICWWDFLIVLQIQPQTEPKQPNYKNPRDFQPKNPIFLRLNPLLSLSLVYLLQFFRPPYLCLFFPFLLTSFLLFFFLLLFFLSKPFTNPTYLPSLHLYNLFLVRVQSLLFRQVPCNPTFTQNPKESSRLLRILLKLVPDTKECSAKTSQKHFQCLVMIRTSLLPC